MSLWPFSEQKQTAQPSDTAMAFARCFASSEGEQVLDYLIQSTRRVLGPNAADTALYYAEGQRALVAAIESLILQGRN